MKLKLYIGNRNYSSWSMRAWLLMRALGIAFDEVLLRLDFGDDSPFRRALAPVSPAGKVPVLVVDDFAVWDTLAIAETLHERFPDKGVWPADVRLRARARSLCSEMHAGFTALRSHCAMNIEADLRDVGRRLWAEQLELRRDVARIDCIWSEPDGGGPYLFGAFGAADAFYAPVCARFITYALPLSEPARSYLESVTALPAYLEWARAARAEHDFLAAQEPYRTGRG